ncbi:hypothetical protein KIN20_007979 [Parelaphostrongylus tenuis]|uniref:Uncharacterized protein n=1 Tax=Parelaphostrongylus tenuis TaxID=148309 RepID=A0AAD5M8W3_PARTN|nr:hypothetical protein KIN20_007979 [Parelaphostrongylus tenuis]
MKLSREHGTMTAFHEVRSQHGTLAVFNDDVRFDHDTLAACHDEVSRERGTMTASAKRL